MLISVIRGIGAHEPEPGLRGLDGFTGLLSMHSNYESK